MKGPVNPKLSDTMIQFSDTVIRYDLVCDDGYLINCHTDKTKEWIYRTKSLHNFPTAHRTYSFMSSLLNIHYDIELSLLEL